MAWRPSVQGDLLSDDAGFEPDFSEPPPPPPPPASFPSASTSGSASTAVFTDLLERALNGTRLDAEQTRPLVDSFAAGGPEHAKIALEVCMRIVEDQSESIQKKICAIQVLDVLMDTKDDFLALQVVSQIKLLSQIAKKSKEHKPEKQRPSCVSATASSLDVVQLLTAICEVLDKWGQRYEDQDKKAPLFAFVKLRRQLKKDNVPLPLAGAYQYASSQARSAPQSTGAAEGLEVHSHSSAAPAESLPPTGMLSFGEAPMAGSPSLESAMSSEFSGVAGGSQSPTSRRERSERKRRLRLTEAVTADADAPQFGGGCDFAAWPTSGFEHASSGSANAPVQRPGSPQSARPPSPESKAGGQRPRSKKSLNPSGDASAVASDPAGDAAARKELESQVRTLQNSNAGLQAELSRMREELGMAWQHLQQQSYNSTLQSQVDHSDGLTSHANLRETNAQMRQELTQLRSDLRGALTKLSVAEKQLAERDEQLSSARQRLFHEQRNAQNKVSQLESELRSRESAHTLLQAQLRDERTIHQVAEQELLRAQFALGRLGFPPQFQPHDIAKVPASGASVPYGPPGGGCSDAEAEKPAEKILEQTAGDLLLKVNQQDELASAAPLEAPLHRLARRGREELKAQTGDLLEEIAAEPHPQRLGKTTSEAWRRSPRVDWAPSVVVSRTPAASAECRERTCTNFRRLLVNHQGPLYEDEHVVLEIAVRPRGDKSQLDRCAFEIKVLSRSAQSLHQISLQPVDMGSSFALTLEMQADHLSISGRKGADQGAAGRREVAFSGALVVRGPFDSAPQIQLSYLFQDNLCCQARFRLPLTLARFLLPVQMAAPTFLQVWGAPEIQSAEVACVCPVRRVFLDSGGLFLLGKCLELGGGLRPLHGVDEMSHGFVLVSSYSQMSRSNAIDVLVRVELGGPRGENNSCRVAVRSSCYLVNRGLANVIVDMLCDSAPPPVAAA